MSSNDMSSADYIALPASEKADRIWNHCVADTNSQPWLALTDAAKGLFGSDMCPSFDMPGDVMPVGRKKYIHGGAGVVGRVEWRDAGGHPYTGIFSGGAHHGIVRLSLARPPQPQSSCCSGSLARPAPGIGLKFLRDGKDSVNLVAMHSVIGQQSWNLLKEDMLSHFPPIPFYGFPFEAKLATATRNVCQVGVSEWSKAGEDGSAEANPRFPYRLRFCPTGDIAYPDEYHDSFMTDLMTISSGTTLYNVHALDAPEELDGTEQMIGELVLTSSLTTSKWGDESLFFRHQDMAEDLQLRPEWNIYTHQFMDFGLGCCMASPFRPSKCRGQGNVEEVGEGQK